jgi:prepilin-type N-terminal cleavage/methylation domain-containing protein
MDKKGITLVELLAAIVLFGIVTALVSTILTTIIRANRDIQISTQANSEGNYIVSVLETEFSKFELDTIPTNCSGTSCILTSNVRYVIVDNQVVLDQDTLQLSVSQELNGIRILVENLNASSTITNRLLTVEYFVLDLTISHTVISNKLRIQIEIDLIDEYSKSHIYLFSYIYELPE